MVHEALGWFDGCVCWWNKHALLITHRENVMRLNELSVVLTTHFALFNLIYRFNGTGKNRMNIRCQIVTNTINWLLSSTLRTRA